MRGPKGKRTKYLVFVSHSGKDTWVARQIAAGIRNSGATVFLDEAAVDVGANFEREILRSLNRANELVVLLTPWALERPYVWAEVGAAWGKGIHIVALLQGITPAELQAKSGVPVFLKQRNLIELNNVDGYFQQLARRVKKTYKFKR